MFLIFEDRPSDSPFVERVWRCRSTQSGRFLSVASPHWEMVVTHHAGTVTLTVRGPETRVTEIDCPADAEWLGIRFSLGTYMPRLPVTNLMDRNDVVLPNAVAFSFWLEGQTLEYPRFDNAEALVARLAKHRIIVRDDAVAAVLGGEPVDLSSRSKQRHFKESSGVTYRAFRQIQRARHAAFLLWKGVSIADTVHEVGYFDQAHLGHSLMRWIRQTPTQIARRKTQLSFLYDPSGSR
jgi:AraC-like DNA-binding protein